MNPFLIKRRKKPFRIYEKLRSSCDKIFETLQDVRKRSELKFIEKFLLGVGCAFYTNLGPNLGIFVAQDLM